MALEHLDPDDRVAAILSAADLSILGADAVTYDRYSSAVRQEFVAVPDDLWLLGRKHVLGQLLAERRLFATDEGHARWEDRAGKNIQRDLASLTS